MNDPERSVPPESIKKPEFSQRVLGLGRKLKKAFGFRSDEAGDKKVGVERNAGKPKLTDPMIEVSVSFTNPGLTSPRAIFDQARVLNPRADLQKGIYTELHVDALGNLYVIPEFADVSAHYASISGTHSMFEARSSNRSLTDPQKGFVTQLPFETGSIVAKGRLVSEDGELILIIDYPTYHAQSRNILLATTGIEDNTLAVDFLVNKAKGDLNIKSVRRANHEVLPISLGRMPKLDQRVAYFLPYNLQGDIAQSRYISGRVSAFSYTENQYPSRVSGEGGTLYNHLNISYDVSAAPARTHQEAVSMFIPDASEEQVSAILSEKYSATLFGPVYPSIQGRHMIDTLDKTVTINLIIEGFERSTRLQDLEYAFFHSYAQAIAKQHGDLGLQTLVVTTSYKDALGKIGVCTGQTSLFVAQSDRGSAPVHFYKFLAERK